MSWRYKGGFIGRYCSRWIYSNSIESLFILDEWLFSIELDCLDHWSMVMHHTYTDNWNRHSHRTMKKHKQWNYLNQDLLCIQKPLSSAMSLEKLQSALLALMLKGKMSKTIN